MNTMQHEVLIVDDEADIRFSVARILEDEGYLVTEASDSASALSLINKKPPNAILLDIWLENSPLNGIEILDLILLLLNNFTDKFLICISPFSNSKNILLSFIFPKSESVFLLEILSLPLIFLWKKNQFFL